MYVNDGAFMQKIHSYFFKKLYVLFPLLDNSIKLTHSAIPPSKFKSVPESSIDPVSDN